MLILSHSLWYTFKIRGSNRNLMVWQFVKFSLYCWLVLSLLDSPGILVNIALLVIAIGAIGVGFRLGHKSVRVYGLVLSLLDVVSLVLLNIDYSNSLQLAGGIILCGGLCFVISFIYSKISKRTRQDAA
jgi:xanthine/uracil permease